VSAPMDPDAFVATERRRHGPVIQRANTRPE